MTYTPEMTLRAVEAYTNNPTRDTVDKLAAEFGKSPKSVIGKLSREGVYRREVYKTKQGEQPVTKAEIVVNIADALGLEGLEGLDKAPKLVLKRLEEALSKK